MPLCLASKTQDNMACKQLDNSVEFSRGTDGLSSFAHDGDRSGLYHWETLHDNKSRVGWVCPANSQGRIPPLGFCNATSRPRRRQSTTFAGRCSAAKSWRHGASNRSNFHRQAPLWCHRSRRRATHSHMQTVSLARRLNRRRTANACALTRSLQSLAVVLGLEVGGRFSREAASFLRELAKPRARESPERLPGAQQTKQTSLRSWALPGWHACGLRGHQFQQIVRAVE